MAELLRTNLYLFVVFTGVIGLILTRKNPKNFWTSFPFFLIVLGVLDGLGKYVFEKGIGLYYYSAFLLPLQTIYYLWLLNNEFPNRKRSIFIGIIVFIIILTFELVLNQNNKNFYFAGISFSIAAILILGKTLWYFYQLSKNEKILSFYTERMFWVASGLLIYWLLSLPYYGIFNFLFANFDFNFPVKNLLSFVLVINYIMYTSFIISFVCGVKKS